MNSSRNIEDIYPLSLVQQGMLFHSLYDSEPGVYCAQWSCTLHGNLHVSVFKRTWQHVIDRHPVLRTSFNWEYRDEPFQIVYRRVDLPWRQYDWQGLSPCDQERQLATFLKEDRERGFALSKAPLMRLTLIRLAEHTYQCVWSLHQLLADGWSLSLLLHEVFQLYDAWCVGRELHLEICRPYGDYIAWLQQQDLSSVEAFWRQTLQGFTTPTVLHVRRDQSSLISPESGYDVQQIRLTAAATATLQALAQRHRLSLNTLMQGAWALLLHHYSGQEDVVFGTTVSGRPTNLGEAESMVGLFINTLPARVRVVPASSLLPWLHELQSQQAEARQYEYSPLAQVQSWSDVPHGLPLFESIVVYENYPRRYSLQEQGRSLEIRQVHFAAQTNYPLTVVAVPGPELELRISYQCQRFDAATIVRMLGHIRILLEGMGTDPAQRLADLPILTTAERHQLLVEWNDTHKKYPQDTCIHRLFEAQVERTPDAAAIVFEDQQLTYRELNARANQLAHYLQTQGVGPEVLVGLCAERSIEMVVGILGILKVGGAYVPLDPIYPKTRLTFILADTQMRVLLTQKALLSHLPQNETHVLCLDTGWETLSQESTDNVDSGVTANNLAYVLYTSGSTGQPKGVMIEQRSVVNHVCWCTETLFHEAGDTIPFVARLTFDSSLKQLFAPLLLGKSVWLLPSDITSRPVAFLDALQTREKVMLNCVPSLWEALLDTCDTDQAAALGKSITTLLLGGERVTTDLIDRTFAVLPSLQIWNLYGPTETTATISAAKRISSTTITIGRPIANLQFYVLDSRLHPVPFGVQGELHIGGASIARGYLNQPALTAEQFISHPFSAEPGARLYKTGDLARYLPDGNIEFLGRIDNQVKIRGYRIELGEIETTLERHPAIRQAIVLAREDHAGDRHLVAYCVPHLDAMLSIDELRRFSLTQLPDYMVPAAFIVLDNWPLTPNGKVDRQALPAADQAQSRLSEVFVSPRTPIEELLAGIWADVLGVEAVGTHDNFFALGGHSLLAMKVMSRLRKTLQADIPLRALFETPTVTALARRITMVNQTVESPSAPPLKAISREEAVLLTMTQEHLRSLDQLLPGAPFSNMPYAVRLTGSLNVPALEQSFNEIVKRHEVLRTTFTTAAGRPVQIIAPTLRISLTVEDLCSLPEAEREATAQQLIRAAALCPFDLEKGPLLEVWLLRLSEQAHILLLTMHHIISDGWSRDVLLHELAVLYDAFCHGKPSPLPDLPLQYADFAYWHHQWLRSAAAQAQLAYWMQQLQEPLPVLELPTDRPRTGALSLRMARQACHIPGELCAALTRLSQRESTTVFMTLLAAFKALLYNYTGQEDIRVGTLVANRQYQETEGLIGLFANVVIVRTHLGGDPTLHQVLQRVRTTTLAAYAHQELPLEYLIRTLVRERNLDSQSLFQVMFVMQNAGQRSREFAGLELEVLETQPVEASTCDIAVSVRTSRQGLDGWCLYKTTLFDATTITRMLGDFQRVLACLSTQPEQPLSTINIRGDI